MMGKKLRQITDNIHGTIYLSEFESKLISTPYFYRLHDIYQSSTVYLTFPSNRTKRYEHSIGTMELASELFFAGMTNASSIDRKDLLEQLYDYVFVVVDKLSKADVKGIEYLTKNKEGLSFAIPNKYLNRSELEKCIFNSVKNESILDSALEHYAICFFDTLNGTNGIKDVKEDIGKRIAKYLYIYQAILEAIRIAALFHDVGHPPYSHIIEEVLQEIYSTCKKDDNTTSPKFINDKREYLLQCLESFIFKDKKSQNTELNFLILDEDNERDKKDKVVIHEQVGLRMLQLAIEEVFPIKIKEFNNSSLPIDEKVGKTLYHILVVEFTFAILLEKSMLFKSLHRIIDGVIDADRLDYIVRDSQNSGVNWGRIPYKRVIDSAKLVKPITKSTNFFAIAFPQKEQEDLEDILIMRYKIFSRINFHHRSEKTAILLQNAVKSLSYDYLKSPNDQEISKDIAGLWTSLGATLGEKALQVGQWNDSWLITVLYGALIKLSDDNLFHDLVINQGKNQDTLEETRDLLKEVLLNHKHYYSLIKRKNDLVDLANLIFTKSGLKQSMKRTKAKELEKFYDNSKTQEQHSEAEESLLRIKLFEKFLKDGDFDLFQIIFPPTKSLVSVISDILDKERKKGTIDGFYVLENTGRNKKGLPSSEDVTKKLYLYDSNLKIQEYSGCDELEKQINSLRSMSLAFFVYIKYKDDDVIAKDILNKIANKLGHELRDVFCELFPSNKKDNEVSIIK